MSDNIVSAPVICQGGYDSTENHLNLDMNFPGRASRLVNYEVGLTGGYRKISGFSPYDVDFPTVDDTNAEGKILGIFIYENAQGNNWTVMAARKQKSGNTYKWYRNDATLGWVAYTTGLTLSSSGVDKIRAGKVNFGGVSYIIFVDGTNKATVFDGTNWEQLDSANTGGSGSPGGDQLINAPSLITIYKNHVFLSGDLNAPSVVVHSAPNDVYTWTAAGGAGQLPTGFVVNQIRSFRDILYVFGLNNISNITVSGTNFVVNQTTTDMGCLAPDSVIEMNADLYFIAPDGVRPVSGTNKIGDVELATVSKPIQSFFKSLVRRYPLDLMCSVIIREKSQFRYFISQGDGTDVGTGIIGGLRTADGDSGWEFAELMGITASVAESDYINGIEVILHGGFDGGVYKQEDGNNFNGEDIVSIYSTPYLTFGDSRIRKDPRYINTFYRSEGNFDVTLSFDYDWGMDDVVEPDAISQNTLAGNVAIYDSGDTYDGGAAYGGGSDSPVIRSQLQGSFLSIKITWATQDQFPSHSIHGFVLELTQQARR